MLGSLLVLVQVVLFLCILALLLLMLKNINRKRSATDGAYVSAYQEDEPDYRDYEYEDNGENGYDDDYYEEAGPEAQIAARRMKSQQFEYAEESERYYAEMENVQRYAEQEEASWRFAEQNVAAQRFTASAAPAYQAPPETAPRYAEPEYQAPPAVPLVQQQAYAEPEPPRYQPEPERPRYYNEEPAAYAPKPTPKAETPPKAKPLPPEPKGVLFDDNDDDAAPFKVKF